MSPTLPRRSVATGLAWSVPAVLTVAHAPAFAASAPTTDPTTPGTGPTTPVDPDPTPVGQCGCTVDWDAESFTDTSLPDYSNTGYTLVKNDACGYLKIQHWVSTAGSLQWRVALGTRHALEAGAVLDLGPIGDNWDVVVGTLVHQTGSGAWQRFVTGTTGYAAYPTGEVTYTERDGHLIVTLPAMPDDSHVIFTVTGRANEPISGNVFTAHVKATGAYTPESLTALGC